MAHRGADAHEWLEQYEEVTRLACAVLSHCPRLPTLALSVVNPRHPLSPEHLELTTTLQKNNQEERSDISKSTRQPDVPPLTLMAKEWARSLLYVFRETLAILRLRWRVGSLLRRAKREPADVVLKTWGFGPESLTGPVDFYYGTLPQLLQRRGVSCVLLCGDARGGGVQSAFARTALAQTHIRYVPEKLLVPLWAPLVTAWNQLLTSFALRRLAKNTEDGKFGAICAHACLHSLKPYVTACTCYFYIARAAVKTWRAKAFVTLYEGQPWEKPSWLGAKAASPECVTVGYQHTVIMPHSLSLLSPNNGWREASAPDCVLCLGEATQAMMKPGHAHHGTKLIPFGSFRRALVDSLPRPPRPGCQTVVVVPEGLPSEATLLFNFAIRVASLTPEYHFIFRCHPVLPFRRVRPHLERDPAMLPNIEMSEHPIQADFARSSIILYRGSSAVLYAVLHGLKPVYLHDDSYPDVDPLFALRSWRECASSVSEMVKMLRQYASVTEERAVEEWRGAAEYVNAYTTPVSEASVDGFLMAVGLRAGVAAG